MDDQLAKLLAGLFEWEDDSPIHAVMHVENAVRNLQAELGVAKAFHDLAVKERDLARLQLAEVTAACRVLLNQFDVMADEWGGCLEADALEQVLEKING
jgi:hypothetical protein